MPAVSGRNAYALINAVDQSANINEIDVTVDVGMEDSTTFGASVDSKSFTVTLKDGKFTLKGPRDATFSANMWALVGQTAATAFQIGPAGSTTGLEKISGNMRIKSIKESVKVGGLIEIQVECVTDGTVTRATFP